MREISAAEYSAGIHKVTKSSKYHNKKTLLSGRVYDSKKEAKYSRILEVAKKAMFPSQRVLYWIPQIPFKFSCGTKMIVDFLVLYADSHFELHEVKSPATRTQLYKIKKKMLKNEYGLEISEK